MHTLVYKYTLSALMGSQSRQYLVTGVTFSFLFLFYMLSAYIHILSHTFSTCGKSTVAAGNNLSWKGKVLLLQHEIT